MKKEERGIEFFLKAKRGQGNERKVQIAENAQNRVGDGKRLLISFAIAAVLFCICLFCIKSVSEGEEMVLLYVASEDIPENTQMIQMDIFEQREVPKSLVPKRALYNPEQMEGNFAVCDIDKGQIITETLFQDKKDWGQLFERPLEVSVGSNSIADVVGGTVRKGDLVNVSTVVQKKDGEYVTISIVEKAYVTRTFTQGGETVESHDREQPVTIINLIIDGDREKAFHTAVEQGTLRISRVLQ